MNIKRRQINVSYEVYQRLTANAKYGDSLDSLLRKALGMKTSKGAGRPMKKRKKRT